MQISTSLVLLLISSTTSALIVNPEAPHSPAARYPSIDFRSADMPDLEKRKGSKGGSSGGSSAAVRVGGDGLMVKLVLGAIGGGLVLL